MTRASAWILTRLAQLQFPLLFVPALLIGCGTFGFGFEYRAADITLALLGAFLWVHAGRHLVGALDTPLRSRAVFAGLALAALALYRPLHLDFWDERSVPQALALAAAGLLSQVTSLLGSRSAERLAASAPAGLGGDEPQTAPPKIAGAQAASLAVALLALVSVWLLAYDYPLIALGALAPLGALLTAVGLSSEPRFRSDEPAAPPSARGGSRYGLLLAGHACGWTLWDFQQDPRWALHLAVWLTSAAFASAFLAAPLGGRARSVGLALAVAGFLPSLLFPAFVLHFAHLILPGAALGLLLVAADDGGRGGARVTASALPIGFGMALGLPFALNLVIAPVRAVLLVPVLVAVLRSRRSRPATADLPT